MPLAIISFSKVIVPKDNFTRIHRKPVALLVLKYLYSITNSGHFLAIEIKATFDEFIPDVMKLL